MNNKLFKRLICAVTAISMLATPAYSLAGDLYETNGSNEQILTEDDGTDADDAVIIDAADDSYDPEWYKSFDYTIDEEDQRITLNSFDDGITELEIPATAVIDGKSYDVWLGVQFFYCKGDLKTISIDDGVYLSYGSHLFERCTKIEELDLTGVRTNSETFTSMTAMFYNMYGLKKLKIGELDTANVTDMYQIFHGCSSLEDLDFGAINTSKVTDMGDLFYDCKKLKRLDLSRFDTSSVRRFGAMFWNCNELENLNLSNFETSNVSDMSGMFCGCKKITELDLSSFDTSKVTMMQVMFAECDSLKKLDLSTFDTSKVIDMSMMFARCPELETIDLSNFNTSNTQKMNRMFLESNSLKSLDLSGFDMTNVSDAEDMFTGCDSLTHIKTPVNVPEGLLLALPMEMKDKKGNTYEYLPNGKDSAQSIELSADGSFEPEEKQELRLENLSYSFDNSRGSFGYPDSYKIPLDSFVYLFGNNVKAKYYFKQQNPWQGNCMGFSGTSALLFDDGNGLYTTTFYDGAEKISDLTPTLSSNLLGIDVTRFIEVMQISQKTDQIASDLKKNKIFTFDLESGKKNLDTIYEQIKKNCSQNEPVLLGIWQNGGHAVLAYKTEEYSDKENRVYIYDSNHPGEMVYIPFIKNENGNMVSWMYDMGRYGIWGSAGESAISYVPYNTLNEVWKLRGKLGETKNTASFNSKDFSIYDAEDKLVATVTNGVLNTENSDIYELFDDLTLDKVSEDEMITLVMPVDVYTIRNNDADLDNFHFEVVDTMQGLTVDTTADEVVLVVADDYGLNSVQLDASVDDSYSISLDSSIEDDIASVYVSGMGSLNGEMVEVSQNAGDVSVGNGVISSLIYDGEEMITYTVSANAGQGGSIDPSGIKTVVKGKDQLYKITPDAGYEIADVLVDGVSLGAVNEYLFSAIDKDHTIEARFFKNDMHAAVGEKQTIKLEKGMSPVKEWVADKDNIVKISAKQKRSCKVTGLAEGIVCVTGLDKNKDVVIQRYIRIEKPMLADQVIRSGEEFSVGVFITGARDCRPTKYRSSKSSVLKIDKKTGTASAKKNGTAKVTVWYGTAKYTAIFEVQMPVISEKKATVRIGETKTLEVANALEEATYRWESSKESIVTVSEDGILTPVKKGKAKITMYYTVNGKEYVGSSCTVTIKK